MEECLNIAICEDTKSDEEQLLSVISRCSVLTKCSVFHNGEEFLASYLPHMFDLILTDIYMGDISGVDIVTKIRKAEDDVPVAFITTSTEHALEGYRLSVLKYIEKPYKEKEIFDMLKFALMEKNSAPALIVQKNHKDERIPYSQISYLEQQTHQLNIHLKDGSVLQIYKKLSSITEELEENDFFIPHKSFAVNMYCVKNIDAELRCFVMQDGKNIPIRRESMGKAKKSFEQYLFKMTRGGL